MTSVSSGCCGPIENQMVLVKKISETLVTGHRGLADMYRRIAAVPPPGGVNGTPEEAAFWEAAKKQDELAEASAQVTVPDEPGGDGT